MALGRLLREFMAPAPDPRRTYRHVESLEPELLGNVRAALSTIAASRDQLDARTTQIRQRLPRFEDEARQALAEGRKDVARQVLERRQIAARELELLEKQLRAADLEAERLALVEQRLAARIEAFLARERMVEARQSAAEVQVRVGEALAGISEEIAELGPELARAEDHAEELEARAAAIDRLLDVGALGALEVERQLDQLERELGAGA
jgi:phage shock protein A